MIRFLTRSALVAIMPSGGALKGVADTGLDPFLRQFYREAAPMLKLGMYLSLFFFHATPLITVGLPLPAFLLPQGLMARHAIRITTHRIYVIRSTAYLLKMVAGLCWGQDPQVRQALRLAPLKADPGTFRGQL